MSVHVQPANWAPSAGYREFMAELKDYLPRIPEGMNVCDYIVAFDRAAYMFIMEGPGWSRVVSPNLLVNLDDVDPSRHLNFILCMADAPCTD